MSLPRIIGVAALALVSTQASAAAIDIDFATPLSIWLCVCAAVIVFSAIVLSVFAFRPASAAAPGSKAPLKTARETIWALVPVAIVIGAATPALTTIPNDLTVVASKQAARATDHCVAGTTLPPTSMASISERAPQIAKLPASSCLVQR